MKSSEKTGLDVVTIFAKSISYLAYFMDDNNYCRANTTKIKKPT